MRLSKIAYSISLAVFQLSSNVRCLPQGVSGIPPLNEPPFNQPPSNEPVPEPLSDRWDIRIKCDLDGYPVKRKSIAEGIKYLRNGVTGSPSLGPIDFERVSCSHKSGIYWANLYYKHRFDLDSYGEIADGAQMILDECSTGDKYVSGEAVFTTLDDPEGAWAVFVEFAHC
ncbi:hypothetical protein QBC45DRAFT_443427 [Copromyces sp. CBS 386.78]|nr:hypothetical protein QBC45DRAFT_443427 [Copromyces sp. CBS 386.78]